MSKKINMPDLPRGAADGTLRRWFKAPGDSITAGDVIAEIETDRTVVELEASEDATMGEILLEAGRTALPGVPLASLTAPREKSGPEGDGDAGEASPVKPESLPAPPPGGKSKPQATERTMGKAVAILMPKAGNDMEEGTVLKWRVAEGSPVAAGDVLFELETDKATMEIESEFAGTVQRIVVPEGGTVAVHTPLAYLADSPEDVDAYLAGRPAAVTAAAGAAASSSAPSTATPASAAEGSRAPTPPATAAAPSAASTTVTPARDGRIKASPAARRMAAERGVSFAGIAGSGAGGRIITSNLEGAVAPAAAAGALEPVRRPMSGMRKAIARNVTASKQTAPHFYMKLTIEAERLMAAAKRQKEAGGAKLNDLILLAVGRAMAKFPALRSQVEGDALVEYPGANIGTAVAVEGGLRVPVVLNVDRLGLAALARETSSAIGQARAGKSVPMGKATLTISNLGMTGVEEFTAIINPPEAAILAVGAVREDVKVEGGAMRPTKLMTMWLSCDHRAVDGLMAAEFLGELRRILEEPEGLES